MTRSIPRSLAQALWAKTLTDPATNELIGWLPLPVHLRDTAEVARLLLKHRKSRQYRAVIEAALPEGLDAESLVWLLGALHDAGKAGPNFQAQSPDRAERLYRQSADLSADGSSALNIRDRQEIARQSEFPHSLASEVIVAAVLGNDFGLSTLSTPGTVSGAFKRSKPKPRRSPVPIVRQLASILGAHHGMSTHGTTVSNYVHSPRWTALLGTSTSPWPQVQKDLVTQLVGESGIDFDAEFWHDETFQLDRGVLSLLAGIVIEADWIASNHEIFPLLAPEEDFADCAPSSVRADNAWSQLRLPSLWVSVPESTADAALRSRFPLPASARAKPGQRIAFAATSTLREPALVIIEDETGSGKTEGGLLAAENLARANGASGVFFGLPTQATTNGMFSRFAPWVAELASATGPAEVSVNLAHGKAALNREWRALRRLKDLHESTDPSSASPSTTPPSSALASGSDDTGVVGIQLGNTLPDDARVDDDGQNPAGTERSRPSGTLKPGTHTWLSGRKKRLLSDFVIGTVDQLLMASLRARHLMLRHSGLADKVVIIDEVHAADTTMQLFLRKSLVWLGRWGVSVIVLTATLPPGQKRDIIAAYQQGLAQRARSAYASPAELPHDGRDSPDGSSNTDQDSSSAKRDSVIAAESMVYPALTVARASKEETIPIPRGASRSVRLRELSDDEDELVSQLRALSREGGCFAVIRNSVARVQSTAERLRREFGDSVVTVAHARFAAADRAKNDRELLQQYGKDSETRPDFSIVCASQVIEQSLDIDFDAMITDMCPVDLLIQRLGRVQRHSGRSRPGPLEDAMCFVTGIGETDGLPTFSADSEYIYGRHLLLRSLAALRALCPDGVLTSPDDVAPLVHAVYGDGELGPPDWQPTMLEAATIASRKESEIRELAHRWVTGPEDSIVGLDDWLNDNDGDPEDLDPHNRARGSVRDGTESIEVLLVLTDGTGWRTLDWLPQTGGVPILTEAEVPRHIAEAVANSLIRLPFAMSQGRTGDAVVAELEKLGVPSWQRSPVLRGQLVLPLAPLAHSTHSPAPHSEAPEAENGSASTYSAVVGPWTVTYDRLNGLSAQRTADSP